MQEKFAFRIDIFLAWILFFVYFSISYFFQVLWIPFEDSRGSSTLDEQIMNLH